MANKTAAENPVSQPIIEDGILSKLEAIDNGKDEPVFDAEFPDFDIDPTIVEAPTTAIISFEDEDYHLKRCLLVLSGAGCAKVNDWDMKIARQHHGHTSQ